MVTLKQSCKRSGGHRALNPRSQEGSAQEASRTAFDGELIITGSFNGLMGRLALIDYWDAWAAGSRITKGAKKMGVEATIGMSEVSELTGLTSEDIEVFCSSLGFINIVETGEDPLLLASDVFVLLKIFERFFDQGII